METGDDVAMVDLDNMVRSVFSVRSVGHSFARILGGERFCARWNRAGENSDSVRHGGESASTGGGNHDYLPNASRPSQWTPPYVIGGVAMVLLFGYAFKNGMDDRVSDLVSGVVGLLVGMRIGRASGNGK